MNEHSRFMFLVSRDGIQAAREWMARASIQYRTAMTVTNSFEWAKIYCETARECDIYAVEPKCLA